MRQQQQSNGCASATSAAAAPAAAAALEQINHLRVRESELERRLEHSTAELKEQTLKCAQLTSRTEVQDSTITDLRQQLSSMYVAVEMMESAARQQHADHQKRLVDMDSALAKRLQQQQQQQGSEAGIGSRGLSAGRVPGGNVPPPPSPPAAPTGNIRGRSGMSNAAVLAVATRVVQPQVPALPSSVASNDRARQEAADRDMARPAANIDVAGADANRDRFLLDRPVVGPAVRDRRCRDARRGLYVE